jgi:hypothetical protein
VDIGGDMTGMRSEGDGWARGELRRWMKRRWWCAVWGRTLQSRDGKEDETVARVEGKGGRFAEGNVGCHGGMQVGLIKCAA